MFLPRFAMIENGKEVKMKNSKHIIKGLLVFIFTITIFNCSLHEVLASSDLYVNYYGIEISKIVDGSRIDLKYNGL